MNPIVMVALGVGVFLASVKLFKPVAGSTIWIDRATFPYPEYIDEFWTRVGRYFWPIFAVALPGYDWTAVASIMAWETGYLSDPNAKRRVTVYNNMFGIEPSGKAGKYPDVAACVRYFDYLMHLKPDTRGLYAVAYRVRGDGEAFIIALNRAGYNSTSTWLEGVLSIYRSAGGKA